VRNQPHLLICKDGEGDTPLLAAIEEEHWEIAEWLVSQPGVECVCITFCITFPIVFLRFSSRFSLSLSQGFRQ